MTSSAAAVADAWPVPRSLDPAFKLMLASGGDERIRIDPLTGRNRYGTPAGPAQDEVWLASSTASSVTPRGFAASRACFHDLMAGDGAVTLPTWFDTIRRRLLHLYGIPGTDVVLTGSGTEAELIALSLARKLVGLPLTNLVVAPTETGSGVLAAAGGRHFLSTASCGQDVARGERLSGLETTDVRVECVDIRSADGRLREPGAVDAEAAYLVEQALQAGRAVLAHVLDCSKTGQSGLQRSTAEALVARNRHRVVVLVDACQLRCSAERIRKDLAGGAMVMITGSKFAGGPPFAGALLVPPALVGRLDPLKLPGGLESYSAAHDWPARLRHQVQDSLSTAVNVGLGLRWEAALAELERVAAVGGGMRARIVAAFGSAVRAGIADHPGLALLDEPRGAEPTIYPVLTEALGGGEVDAVRLHEALRSSTAPGDRCFHVGQPVAVGSRKALRICLSAPMIVDVAERLAVAGDLEAAMRPVVDDLTALLEKWSALRTRLAG